MWSRLDEEVRLCKLWLQEPLTNPETGHPIERNGPTFKAWKKRCKNAGLEYRPKATREMTWRKCQEWRRYPDINPDTGRKIKKDGALYKKIQQQCELIEQKEMVLLGEYYLPDSKGMVPCVVFRGTWYVVRKLQRDEELPGQRKVWGPLNKPAKGIKLCYYMDTWDYHYNHYKPVFVDGPPPKQTVKKVSAYRKRFQPQQEPEDWLARTFTKKPPPKPKTVLDTAVDLFVQSPNTKEIKHYPALLH